MKKNIIKMFHFDFPLSHKVVRNLKIVREHIGNLSVSGSATEIRNASPLDTLDERYTVDIDFVRWEGTDIKPVLELTGLMDDIQEAAYAHVSKLFNDLKEAEFPETEGFNIQMRF